MNAADIDERILGDAEQIYLSAYNAAFYELGLKWHWDLATYQALQACADGADCIGVYLEAEQPHLLKVYDADFLIGAIRTTQERCYANLISSGSRTASRVDWAAMQSEQIGV